MEIEKKQAPDGKAFINFKDNLGVPCRMAIGWGDLRFLIYTGRNLPDYAVFTQEQVKYLLPYLQSFAESGTLEPATESTLQGDHLSQLAQEMLGIIAGNPPYIAGWSICGALGTSVSDLDCSIPGTKYDEALKELIDAGVVEELPELKCRYQLTEKYKNAQSPLQGEMIDAIANASVKCVLDVLEAQKERIEALTATTARMNYRNYRYEQLLNEWKKYGQPSSDSKSSDELIHLTDEIMRESALSVDGANEIEKANRGKAYYQRQCDKQVDEIADLEELLATMQEAGVAMAASIVDQGKRIEALEQLVREWQRSVFKSSSLALNDLQKRTNQLLGE